MFALRQGFTAQIRPGWQPPACRGQGYAKAALAALEDQVRAAGLARILLHVFAHNQTARALSKKAGYWNCDYSLLKLPDRPSEPAA